ncbi:MAG: S-methyl-5'-thioadenosine phosphorylase [Deltaproteobacteria bacterium]|nr:S-methyl-5'-thioadenosine phosphorylase [Deltaproteobacteria bacterium]
MDNQTNNHDALGPQTGIIGGTGFYSLFQSDVETWEVETPYGAPSSPVTVGSVQGVKVAFLSRHGDRHQYPPHVVNYQANIWALKRLGVNRIIAVGAVGALQKNFRIGEIVLCDQFVNRTWGRKDTYYDGPVTTHISVSDPYCADIRKILLDAGSKLDIPLHAKATLLIIQGPRFSTKAENRDWRNAGYDLVSMTHYPEVALARELGICYVSLCLVTDHATVLGDNEADPVSDLQDVVGAFKTSHEKIIQLLDAAIPRLGEPPQCACHRSLEGARAESGWIPLWFK